MENVYYNCLKCSDININQAHCGFEKCKPSHFYGPYIRDHYLLHYVQKGKGILKINDTTHNICEGEIFFIPPNVITYYEADSITPWEYKWIGISGSGLDVFFEEIGINTDNPVFKVSENTSKAIDDILIVARKDGDNPLKYSSLVYTFLDTLSPKFGSSYKTNSQSYVQKALDYIWKYIYKKIEVYEIAEYIKIDRSYLTSIFKEYTGKSPQQYILHLKIKSACEYLLNTDYTITQIAHSVGYDDVFVFSHTFKKVMNICPRDYRANINNKMNQHK